ncbi:transmembrane amino acid transporter protein-domain-containing protein [Dichomitus squalens]|nr:transmembrane amino acid transporter protein-domain-containing protein [Dichomitus squalens]
MSGQEYEPKKASDAGSVASTDEEQAIIKIQIQEESGHQIKYRSCSWQKTAALLFSEYICLAILSFPWSYSVLGLVPGIILTLVVAVSVLYTSLVLWRYCMKHPEIRDVCDIGQALFGGSKWAYNATAVFFLLNNTFIQALHVLVGAKLLNTLTNSAACTIVFSVVSTLICIIFTLPRTLNELSYLGTFSAITMGIAVLLAIIFAGVEENPFGWTPGADPIVTAWPVKGTTFVAGMSAFMNITYTFVGQITLPSFIAEMKEPKDFPKALWAVSIAEMVVFTLCGALVYHWTGNQYMTAPAFGSLSPLYKKIAFSFAIPTIVFLGALYGSVTARFLFFRIFKESHHRYTNTVKGWSTWVAIIVVNWIIAFVIAEVIPFFSDMLSLMCSLFDCWFGFIFWGLAYMTLYPGKERWAGLWRSLQTALNYFIILVGIFIMVAGTYASVQSIVDSYRASAYGSAFTCASNAL